MASSRQLILMQDPGALAARAAEIFEQVAGEAIRLRGRAMIALAGGSTPEKTYRILAGRSIDWTRIHLFFSDERFVPLDDPSSNYGMARRALFDSPNLQNAHIHPVPVDASSAAEAAERYEATLVKEFDPKGGKTPAFDLIVLGLGDDGHTASLFPGSASLQVKDRLVVASPAGKLPPPVERITFTFPLINAAHKVAFLVEGKSKERALTSVLEDEPTCDACPAVCVHPDNGEVIWLVDEAASGRLRKSLLT
jgi:6-phosphogluconolactonase